MTDNIFSIDSRLFITLKHLITKPGFLTLEYWEGRRTKYLPPLKLYLVLSVLYFFVISTGSNHTSVFNQIATSDSNNDIDRNSLISRIDELDHQIFNYFINIFNRGLNKTKELNLSYNDIVFNMFPRAMFILMPLMGVLLLLIFKKRTFFIHTILFQFYISIVLCFLYP